MRNSSRDSLPLVCTVNQFCQRFGIRRSLVDHLMFEEKIIKFKQRGNGKNAPIYLVTKKAKAAVEGWVDGSDESGGASQEKNFND